MVRRVFAERLRSLRLERGLTQGGLAARSEVSVDAVRRLEKARYSPTLDTVSKLARGLGLSVSGMLAVVVTAAECQVEAMTDKVVVLVLAQKFQQRLKAVKCL